MTSTRAFTCPPMVLAPHEAMDTPFAAVACAVPLRLLAFGLRPRSAPTSSSRGNPANR